MGPQEMKLVLIVGTRPNFMKAAPLILAAKRYKDLDLTVVHTGQHYDVNMSDVFFDDLGIDKPDVNLLSGTGKGLLAARVVRRFIETLESLAPDYVVVVGDVDSTLAGCISAFRAGIPVAHVEAGLRSLDAGMPEEKNRFIVDMLSSLHFVTEVAGMNNLRNEGIPEDGIHFVGNTMIDTLIHQWGSKIAPEPKDYVVLTLHRPSNVDCEGVLQETISNIIQAAEILPIVFPVHPRTIDQLDDRLSNKLAKSRVETRLPMGYREFVKLMESARVVLTDSGGIQEETSFMGIPCLTLRDNTERPVTIEHGTNKLVGEAGANLLPSLRWELSNGIPRRKVRIPMWDGKTGERIMRILVQEMTGESNTKEVR